MLRAKEEQRARGTGKAASGLQHYFVTSKSLEANATMLFRHLSLAMDLAGAFALPVDILAGEFVENAYR